MKLETFKRRIDELAKQVETTDKPRIIKCFKYPSDFITAIIPTEFGCIIAQNVGNSQRINEIWLTNSEINFLKTPINPRDGIDIITELHQIERRLSLMIQQQIKGTLDNSLLLETRDYTRKLLRQLGYRGAF